MGHEYYNCRRPRCAECRPTFWQEWRTLFLLMALILAMLWLSVYVAMGELDLPLRPAAIILPFALASLDHGPPREVARPRLPAPRMAPSRAVPLAPWRMRRLWHRINRDMAPYGLGHMALATWREHTPLAREIAIAVAIEHMRGRRT